MNTLEIVRNYMDNEAITIDKFGEVRLEETGQTLGVALVGEEAVMRHLETLHNDSESEDDFDVDVRDLYDAPQEFCPWGELRFLGENTDGTPVWYQGY